METSKDSVEQGQDLPEIRRPSVLLDVTKVKANIAQLNANLTGE